MSSTDIYNFFGDCFYWLFENTLEPMADWPWRIVLIGGFVAFGFWMKTQAKFNKEAEANPNQLK